MTKRQSNLGLTLLSIGVLIIGLAGCAKPNQDEKSKAPPPSASPAALDKEPEESRVTLRPEMISRLKLFEAKEVSTAKSFTVTGKIHLNDDQTAQVLTPVAGHIVQMNLKVGDPVQKDQVLFAVKSREVALLATDYVECRRTLELARKTHTMTKELYDNNAAARIALDQAKSEMDKAEAQLQRAAEALKIYGLDPEDAEKGSTLGAPINVRSPISGIVLERMATLGQFVQPETGPLLRIGDTSSVWVLADVFERDIRFVEPGARAEMTTVAYPDERFTARVARIHDAVDPETRALKVRFLVSNPSNKLKPEMFASVMLFVNESESAVLVPQGAVITEGERTFVFVRTSEFVFQRREVETSAGPDGRVKVLSGLRAGESVVQQGALLLRRREEEHDSQ